MPEIDIVLPTLHPGQIKAWNVPGRRKAWRCARRFGKTALLVAAATNCVAKGRRCGIFAPQTKFISEPFTEIRNILKPIEKNASRNDGIIRTIHGGHLDAWALDKDLIARGRKYHLVLIDEAARAKPNMWDIWTQSIKPTLVDYGGTAIVMSNPKGNHPLNFFYKICKAPDTEFKEFHATIFDNPYLDAEELAKLERENDPRVFRQEYLGECVDFLGDAYFTLEKCLENGKAVEYPAKCDYIFVTIDTAVKDGLEHDGTAAVYFARNAFYGHPLVVLDWDVISMTGDLLENWLPSVFERAEQLAQQCAARQGMKGIWIEDRQSGSILIFQGERRGWNVFRVPETLTQMGKSGRAENISSVMYRGDVKISRHAFDKVRTWHGNTMNHFTHQVFGFRMGQKEMAHDDLFDALCEGVGISLGNSEGIC